MKTCFCSAPWYLRFLTLQDNISEVSQLSWTHTIIGYPSTTFRGLLTPNLCVFYTMNDQEQEDMDFNNELPATESTPAGRARKKRKSSSSPAYEVEDPWTTQGTNYTNITWIERNNSDSLTGQTCDELGYSNYVASSSLQNLSNEVPRQVVPIFLECDDDANRSFSNSNDLLYCNENTEKQVEVAVTNDSNTVTMKDTRSWRSKRSTPRVRFDTDINNTNSYNTCSPVSKPSSLTDLVKHCSVPLLQTNSIKQLTGN